LVFIGRHRRWEGVVGFEGFHAPLSGVNVAEKVVVVIKEV